MLQVALANNGTVYVADGYCNARVVEYGPDGAWRGVFELPAPQRMQIPHSLAIDECVGELYVADREAGKVHAFDLATRQLHGGFPASRLFTRLRQLCHINAAGYA